jgi:hypothetical protein
MPVATSQSVLQTCKNGRMATSELPSKLLRIALVLVLLVAIGLLLPFGWLLFRTENFDTPAPIPIFILSALPFLASLIVLAIADDKSASIGAGIAFGSASIYLLLVPVFFFGTMGANWMRHPPYPHLADLRHALGPALLVSACVIIFASLNRKENRAFAVGCATGIFYSTAAFILGYLIISIPGSGAEKAKESDEQVPPVVAAAPILRSLTACLIRHQADHPQDGFPESLENIDASWRCDEEPFKPTSLKHYWTTYRPLKDSQSGRNTDFRIQAISADSVYYSVLVSDKRGMLLEYQQWGVQNPPVAYRVAFAPNIYGSDIGDLALSVRNFMNTFGHGAPPPSIQDALATDTRLNAIIRSNTVADPHNPNTLYEGGILGHIQAVEYVPPSSENPAHFAISVFCLMYGSHCLRSYYLDGFGDTHGTGEPRRATAEDPVIPICERSSDSCDDPVWPLAAQPSDWERTKANGRYLFHSTRWW